MDKKDIRRAYLNYWLENGKRPVSVYAFCQQLNFSESSFYNVYASFPAIEKDLWCAWLEETLEKLRSDDVYTSYSVRDKLSAFYFAWVEHLRDYRSYILLRRERYVLPGRHLEELESFREAFYDYVNDLILEGLQSGEVKGRKYLSDQYVHGFWLQAVFVLGFWIRDDSERFELTDAAIDKAVNLSFQLIGTHTIDSILDFGKFVFLRK